MSIQELIRKYRANIASNQSVGDSLGITLTNEDISRLSLANDKYRDFIKDLQALQSEHKAEIEALERKAWECSVEMMEASRIHSGCTVTDRPHRIYHTGMAEGWEYASNKLREAFGFPKSETPERFKK